MLSRLFGPDATLKRETAVVAWVLLAFIIVCVFWLVQPSDVQRYEDVFSTAFWGLIALLAAIFGIQIAHPIFGGRRSIETTTATVETTKVEKGPDPQERRARNEQ